MSHRRLLVALVLVAGVASCRRAPVLQPVPRTRQASAAELAIYRVLTESTYVRSTGRPIAVVATSLDSACTSAECPPLERRWGIESPWWAGVAGSAQATIECGTGILCTCRPRQHGFQERQRN